MFLTLVLRVFYEGLNFLHYITVCYRLYLYHMYLVLEYVSLNTLA